MNELTQEQQDTIDRCIESFKKLAEQIIEAFKPIVEWFIKTFGPICRNIQYYKKYNMIYMRTKSKRIRKKQINLMRKKVCV